MTNCQTFSLLMIEDSDEDFEAFIRLIRRQVSLVPTIYRCIDGDEALEFLYQSGKYDSAASAPRPGIILLDLNLPGTDGREVLEQIKQDERLKIIPVVVLTTSANPKDIEACYEQGANGYIIKPIGVNQLAKAIQVFLDYWFDVSILPQPARRSP